MKLTDLIKRSIEKLTKKYDLRYFDGSTYAVGEEFENDITTFMTLAFEAGQKAAGNRNAIVKEYEDEGVMFVLMVKDGKTYEASMPIPKWAEVGRLEFREPTPEDLSGKTAT
jgi:hypothetical protein